MGPREDYQETNEEAGEQDEDTQGEDDDDADREEQARPALWRTMIQVIRSFAPREGEQYELESKKARNKAAEKKRRAGGGGVVETEDRKTLGQMMMQVIRSLPPREGVSHEPDIAPVTERKTIEVIREPETETVQIKKVLSPEAAEALLAVLESRFKLKKNIVRHENLDWEKIKERLKENPGKLWSLNEMERTGGEPDVVDYDKEEDKYLFFDCSADCPAGRRNIMYDRKAQKKLPKHLRHGKKMPGNAKDIAESMGIQMLSQRQYEKMQKFGIFDRHSFCWIQTPQIIRRSGVALRGNMEFGVPRIDESPVQDHDEQTGFRGALWV